MELGGPVPTFNDLSIDDNLSQLERVVRYSTSSIALQRLVHVKMLAETASQLSYDETVRSIVPLFEKLSIDLESVVRQVLAEQMEPIARVCLSAGENSPNGTGYRLIIETILPILSRLLGDSKAEVRESAGEALRGVASLMRPADLGQYVLTIILQLAHDDSNEDLRMTAASLLNDLADVFGPDLCKQFVTPDMISLGEDPVFRVRKATALNLHNICRVVGESDSRDRLLPTFIKLTKDDMYRVRKACTESLVEVSKAVGPKLSNDLLIDVFIRLADDSQKMVRNGALQHLGPFISTLPGDKVNAELIRYFTSTVSRNEGGINMGMNGSNSVDNQADTELRLYGAFSFPAVVLTLGGSRWHELRAAYKQLTRDPEWNIRKTLAFSLHEIAKVLSSEQVEEDLLPEVEFFLGDMEEVRVGIVCRLASVFSRLSPSCREKHLPLLGQVLESSNTFNWRLRDMLAGQLPQLVSLFSADCVYSVLLPLTFKLLEDPVCSVRETAFEAIAPLMAATSRSNLRQAIKNLDEPANLPTSTHGDSSTVDHGGPTPNTEEPDPSTDPVGVTEAERDNTGPGQETLKTDSGPETEEVKGPDMNIERVGRSLDKEIEKVLFSVRHENARNSPNPRIKNLRSDRSIGLNFMSMEPDGDDNERTAGPTLGSAGGMLGKVPGSGEGVPKGSTMGIDGGRVPPACGSDAGSSSSGNTSSAVSTGGEERRASMVSMVREFAHAPSYQQRQMYIYICQRLQGHIAREDFITEFMPSLAELATDRVVNVRIALSRTLGTGRCPRWLLDLPPMQRAVRLLSADTNGDVRHFMSFLPETYMTSLKNMHFDDKVLSWLETSSCVSDESTRTQWSISTQRSEFEKLDFPTLQEVPLESRSSSSSSADESGESLAAEEALLAEMEAVLENSNSPERRDDRVQSADVVRENSGSSESKYYETEEESRASIARYMATPSFSVAHMATQASQKTSIQQLSNESDSSPRFSSTGRDLSQRELAVIELNRIDLSVSPEPSSSDAIGPHISTPRNGSTASISLSPDFNARVDNQFSVGQKK